MKTEKLEDRVSYSINSVKDILIVWIDNEIIATLDFSATPELLSNRKYCQNLAMEVALESSLNN